MITYWLFGHNDAGVSTWADDVPQASTCVQEFSEPSPDCPSREADDMSVTPTAEVTHVQIPPAPVRGILKSTTSRDSGRQTGSSVQKGSKGGWTDVSTAEECGQPVDLPTYEELEREFDTEGSPPIMQLTEGYHF